MKYIIIGTGNICKTYINAIKNNRYPLITSLSARQTTELVLKIYNLRGMVKSYESC